MSQVLIGGFYFPETEKHFTQFGDELANYQRPQREKAFEYVTDWNLAIDVGANVGIFSRHFAEKFKTVWAIEPIKINYDCLVKNVPVNVIPKKVALGDVRCDVKLQHTPKNAGGGFVANHNGVDLPPNFHLDESLLETVEMRPLDDFDIPSLGLIKLDIQGSEYVALRGAEQTLRRTRPVVLIEEKPIGGPDGATDHIALSSDFLKSLGMVAREKVGADRVYTFA